MGPNDYPLQESLLAGTDHAGAPVISRQRGVALAIVVWFLAAMALLVSGIVYEARLDVRMAQAHVARAEVEAAGDGAIQLALAAALGGIGRGSVEAIREFQVGGHRVLVEITPVSGLINLNSASEDLLSFLFARAGGLSPDQAQLAASSVIQWKASGAGASSLRRAQRFESVEDLMRVPGISRTLFDGVRDYVVARSGGGGSIDWSAAPAGLLGKFAEKYPKEVAAATRRQERLADLVGGPASSAISGGGSLATGNFRVDATVLYGDQAWVRRRWVSVGGSSRRGVPWRVTRTEGPRVVVTS